MTADFEMTKTFFSFFLFVLTSPHVDASNPVSVYAVASTELIQDREDVMDDPAIWVNILMPPQSLILTTKKRHPKAGLYVYDLRGHLHSVLPVGSLNNVDIGVGFPWRNQEVIDIAVATQVDKRQFAFFAIIPKNGEIQPLPVKTVRFPNTPYGICVQRKGEDFYAIVTFKGGGAEKWRFWQSEGQINLQKVSSYLLRTQAEGCVVNAQTDVIFIAEEAKGIWAFQEGRAPQLIARVGENNLEADLEGLALYKNKYLIVSSQGNSTYAVFDAGAPYRYLGSFQISASSTQEGTERTDGIDVTGADLQGDFAKGLFVAHDKRASKGGGSNFKLVPWGQIAQKLGLD